MTIWMNSVAGKVELVGLTVARGPQPHSIVTHNIVTQRECCDGGESEIQQIYDPPRAIKSSMKTLKTTRIKKI